MPLEHEFTDDGFKTFAKELTDLVRRTSYMECAQILLQAGCPLAFAYLLIDKASKSNIKSEEVH